MRLFVAINFSPEIKDVLLRAIDDLRCQSQSGNFTRPENLHLTLAFIGESDNLSGAKAALEGITDGSFPLSVSGAGHFDDLWWAGIEPNPALNALAKSVRENLIGAGFGIDSKPFKPHITLARRLSGDAAPRLCVPKTTMTVDRVSLMRSDRINGRLTYTEVYGVALS